MKNKKWLQYLLLIAILILINVVAYNVSIRWDLTSEQRFTLSESTEDMFNKIDDIVFIEVLLEGDLPPGFRRFQQETIIKLDAFRDEIGGDLEYRVVDPLADSTPEEKKEIVNQLAKQGIVPTNLIDNRDGYSEKLIYPWAIITYKGRSIPVELLQKQLNKSRDEALDNSIALLEYNLANAMQKLLRKGKPTIAFLEGHGELPENAVNDIGYELSRYYVMERFDVTDNLYIPPRIDVLIVAKPTQKFEDAHRFKIDQYIMNGGKVLWLYENLRAELDSLNNESGSFIALDYGLGLEDQLFKYGARVNFDLVQDVQCTKIPLTVSRDRQLQLFDWTYFPVVNKNNNAHPVTKNLDAVLFRFAGTIDTIPNRKAKIKKTVLLSTSDYTQVIGPPIKVEAAQVKQKPSKATFNSGEKILAVALEGEFPSPFKNILSPSTIEMIDTIEGVSFKEVSEPTKMVVIADGDVISNDYDRNTGRPAPLGYYKFTKETFANRELILNAVEWLNDENGIIEARSKDHKSRLLDEQRIQEESTFWQLLNIVIPVLLILIFGIAYTFIRRRRYQ